MSEKEIAANEGDFFATNAPSKGA